MDFESINTSYEEIKNRANEALRIAAPYAARSSGIYDSSLNKVIVAGIELDGVVEAKLSQEMLTRHDNGIDHRYVAIYKTIEQKTLTVELLPTANCIEQLHKLAEVQQRSSGWFNISIHENGKLVDVYRAWINSLPEVNLKTETDNKVVVFGVKTMLDSVAKIDQPTEFETAIRKEASRPNWADKNIGVDEQTGVTVEYSTVNGVEVKQTSEDKDAQVPTK